MKLPKDGRLYFGLAGIAILVTGGLLYLQKGSLEELNEKVAVLRKAAEAQKGSRTELASAQKDLGELEAKLAHLEQGIPTSAYVPTMLKELETLGKQEGVEVLGLRPTFRKPDAPTAGKENIEAKPYDPLDMELKGKASYPDLLKYIAALNAFPQILEVRTLAITPPPATTSADADKRLDVTMGIRAFLFKQNDQPKKDGAST